MKPRHAAALALVGWYLLIPQIVGPNDAQSTIRDDAPLSEWERSKTVFDSKAECEEAIEEDHRIDHLEPCETLPCALKHAQGERMRCIATDDPRLKSK